MPLVTLNFKTLSELLMGVSSYMIPPKFFGCTCYIWEHSPATSKLDPRALKCISIGYFTTQKNTSVTIHLSGSSMWVWMLHIEKQWTKTRPRRPPRRCQGARRPLAAAIMAKSATLGVGSPNRCRATPRRPRRTPSRVTALADYGLIGRLGRVNRLLGFCFSYPLPFSLADFTFSRAHRHRLSPLSCSQRRWRRLCRARSPLPLSCWYAVAVARSRTPSPSPSPSLTLARRRRRHRLSLSRHLRLLW